jgi:hypothetical protein
MTHRIPVWMALMASGVLAAASAFAQSGGENPTPAGDGSKSMAQAQAGAPTPSKSTKASRHMSGKHAKARHAKHHRADTVSSAGTSAARSDRGLNGEMDRCASMTDRQARAECASRAWERYRGTAG